MLDKGMLKDDIKMALDDTLPPAIEECINNFFPGKSEVGGAMATKFAEDFTSMISDTLAQRLSDAIDTYVKCMSIQGTLITMGSPFTQTAQVMSLPMPALNGKVPMTLGVS